MSIVKGFRSGVLITILGAGVAMAPVALDAAFAKGNNGNGGGNGNGGDNGKGAEMSAERGGGNAGAQGGGKPLRVQEQQTASGGGKAKGGPKASGTLSSTEVALQEDVLVGEEVVKGQGKLRSQMGALNAAHANPQAFANASPNSRVGRIAAYANYYNDLETLPLELEEAIAARDALPVPTRTSEEIQAEIDLLVEPTSEELQALEDELADALAYEQADAEVVALEEEVAALEEVDPIELLEAAANKEVTDEVVEEVNRLLGIVVPEETEVTEVVEEPVVVVVE